MLVDSLSPAVEMAIKKGEDGVGSGPSGFQGRVEVPGKVDEINEVSTGAADSSITYQLKDKQSFSPCGSPWRNI